MDEVFNSKKQKLSCSTFGENYINYGDMTKLEFAYSNEYMIITIKPLKSKDDFIGDDKRAVMITMRSGTASQVADMLYDAKDDYKAGVPFNYSVQCGRSTVNAIGISDGSTFGKEYGVYLAIYQDINADGIPKKVGLYTLKGAEVIKNYEYKTGKHEKVKKPFRELKDIANNFEDFGRASNRAYVHVSENTTKWRRNKNYNLPSGDSYDVYKKDVKKNKKIDMDDISIEADLEEAFGAPGFFS